MKVKFRPTLPQVRMQPKVLLVATLAGLASLVGLVFLVSGFLVGRQFADAHFGGSSFFLLATIVHSLSILTLYQAKTFHLKESYIEYRDWMVTTGALAICNFFLLLEAHTYFRTLALLNTAKEETTLIAILSLGVLFWFVFGTVALLRLVQRSFYTANYLEGFIEGLQVRFAKRQRVIWRLWMFLFAAVLLLYVATAIAGA